MAPFLRFCRCLVFLRNFAKRIICRSILFHGKIMHDSSASSILVHSILMGSHWVQPVFQIWTYPWILQKTTKRPHQGQTPSWLTSHGASCLFFSVENLADWLLNAHGWEVGCKFASSDVFFFWLALLSGSGAGLVGAGLLKSCCFFKAYQLGSEIHRTTLCKSVVFFPWSLFDSSIIPLQLLNTKFKTWHPDSCFQIWYVRPRYSEFSQTQKPPPKKKTAKDSNLWLFGCLDPRISIEISMEVSNWLVSWDL